MVRVAPRRFSWSRTKKASVPSRFSFCRRPAMLAASDGKEAMRVLEKHRCSSDLLVTDVVMPSMGGPALAEALRNRFPLMKVLFSSGYTDDAVVHHGLQQEKVAFL